MLETNEFLVILALIAITNVKSWHLSHVIFSYCILNLYNTLRSFVCTYQFFEWFFNAFCLSTIIYEEAECYYSISFIISQDDSLLFFLNIKVSRYYCILLFRRLNNLLSKICIRDTWFPLKYISSKNHLHNLFFSMTNVMLHLLFDNNMEKQNEMIFAFVSSFISLFIFFCHSSSTRSMLDYKIHANDLLSISIPAKWQISSKYNKNEMKTGAN